MKELLLEVFLPIYLIGGLFWFVVSMLMWRVPLYPGHVKAGARGVVCTPGWPVALVIVIAISLNKNTKGFFIKLIKDAA